jgi:predicted RNase H-like nuclease (RuvC/YqgF family)
MTNDKSKIKELVADEDDATAELETLGNTCDVTAHADNRQETSLVAGLQAAMRERNIELSELELQRQAGRLTSAEAEIRELRVQIERTEAYADEMRRELQERKWIKSEAEDTTEHLQLNLERAFQRISELQNDLDRARCSNKTLGEEIAGIRDAHAEEVRMIRFELGEAQETVVQHELMAEQLASDLVDTRSFRDELEKSLVENDRESLSRIEDLERENRRLRNELEHKEEQLETKSEAIKCLLAELAKKSQRVDSSGKIEESVRDIDGRVSEHVGDLARKDRGRVSRVLIGSVDGQELRFPLFKSRLTIGRTAHNDIQLKANYVSRRHAVIVSDHSSTRVIDWGSRNGVFVNTERVTEHFLRNGDTVTIGTAKFRYEERPKRDQ